MMQSRTLCMLSRCSTAKQYLLPSTVHLDSKGKLAFLNCLHLRRNNKSSVVMHYRNEKGDRKLQIQGHSALPQWDPLSEEKKRKKERKLGCGSAVDTGWHLAGAVREAWQGGDRAVRASGRLLRRAWMAGNTHLTSRSPLGNCMCFRSSFNNDLIFTFFFKLGYIDTRK